MVRHRHEPWVMPYGLAWDMASCVLSFLDYMLLPGDTPYSPSREFLLTMCITVAICTSVTGVLFPGWRAISLPQAALEESVILKITLPKVEPTKAEIKETRQSKVTNKITKGDKLCELRGV